MSEQRAKYFPSKAQTQIQVENFRDTSWMLGEEYIVQLNKDLQRCQKVAALALHYEEQYSMEMNFSKNPLLFFGGSQAARNRARIYKAKSLNFRKQFNIMVMEIHISR